MPKTLLTTEKEAFVRANYMSMMGSDMALHLGIGKGIVNRFQKKHGLYMPKEEMNALRAAKLVKPFTQEQDDYIRANIANNSIKALAKAMKKTSADVGIRVRFLGFGDIIKQHAQNSYIKKGDVPINKGKKQTEFMTAEGIARCSKTRFVKGQKSHTELYDGAISERKDKRGIAYKHIRVGKGKWEVLQRYNWEKANGPIPKGMVLRSIDGDTLNCEPGNWELITKRDNRIRNAGHYQLTDNYLATMIAGKKYKHIIPELTENKELLETKKMQLLLRRKIKSITQNNTPNE